MNIVFIAGIGHSGSTLLDLLLGSQAQTVSLGEIDKIIHSKTREMFMERYIYREKYPCSCGKKPSLCPFWSEFSTYIIKNENMSYADYYQKAIDITEKRFGALYIVDSSKNIHALRRLTEALSMSVKSVTFKVIHLVKDVRNLAASNIRSNRVTGVLRNIKKWTSQNNTFETFLMEHHISYMNVGYEELAISTELTLRNIAAFLGLSMNEVHINLNSEESHILFGNHMRLDEKKSSRIEYDYHWFTSLKIPAWYIIYPGLHRMNMKWVYSNIEETFKKKGEV